MKNVIQVLFFLFISWRLNKRGVFLMIFFLGFLCHGNNIPLLFLGILPGGAPEFEQHFESMVREQLTMIAGVSMSDIQTTAYIKNKVDFVQKPHLSPAFLEIIQRDYAEKNLIIWAQVKQYSIKPVRRYLIKRAIRGAIEVNLSIYSLGFKEYLYFGSVGTAIDIDMMPVFFGDLDATSPVTIEQRQMIVEQLQTDVATKMCIIVSGLVRSTLQRMGGEPTKEVDSRTPSVSDLFDIPTLERTKIENSTKKNTDGRDTTTSLKGKK
ncbi:MAG: hypothetical protein JW795_01945 [Chitinivibrionales bacterium]|nr:hypothetical protein [Chitinivibrionales bacterium]